MDTTKSELINKIIHKNSYKSYLELGLGPNMETFKDIKCEYKYCVDILKVNDNLPNFIGTTNDFFTDNTKKYDLIFIDADHSYESVSLDFINSVKILNDGGIIFMHDIGPCLLEHTDPNSNGEAYKVFIDIRKNQNYNSFTLKLCDTDYIGIVKIDKNEEVLNLDIKDFNSFLKNRDSILRWKTIEEILKIL